MSRDEIRAKGAEARKETNFERYFGTPEKAAEWIAWKDYEIGVFCQNKECGEYDITQARCAACVLDWLGREAED